MAREPKQSILIFLFERPILKHVLFWAFLLGFQTTLPALYAGEITKIFFSNILYLVVDALCVYIVLYFLWPNYFRKGRLGWFFLGLILVILLDYGINYTQKLYFMPALGIVWTSKDPFLNLYQSVSSFSFFLGLAMFGRIVKENLYMEIEAKEREKRYYKAEIAQLRSQINPHFLFNVLNNIDEMIYDDPDKASQALHNMSGILRYSFKDSEGEKVPLKSEVTFIQKYIQLMRFSYPEPDFIEFTIEGDTQLGVIAPMILIPFVENTIKHGKKHLC